MSIDLLYHSSIYEFIIAKLFPLHKLTAIIFSQNDRDGRSEKKRIHEAKRDDKRHEKREKKSKSNFL